MRVKCLNYSAGKKVSTTGGGRRGSVDLILMDFGTKGWKR
jgi:hypothetical protein